MTEDSRARWFVVQTQPHAEKKAAAHLTRQEFQCYLPRYLKRRRHARKTEIVPAPLFPRYMFVAVGECQQWRSIRSTVGVSHLICTGDEPTLVHNRVIDELRKREGPEGFITLDPRPSFAPGDKIQVSDGVFVGHHALFDDMVDRDRVAILLDLLGRSVRVVIDKDSIAAA